MMKNKELRTKIKLLIDGSEILISGLKTIIGDGKCNWSHSEDKYICPVCIAKKTLGMK